ncbi:hypothetical protein GQ44DRAFT_609981 [Phaeosphaeriaceae sp. PMI808]|nr:hypothetical protein GQ44DRAFT_609981 [Phaeosphaeriaceae sp. PMI808]
MSPLVTSNPSTRSSSLSIPVESHQCASHSRSQGTFSFKAAFKKPFQGWSKELLRARDDDDDDYNFTSGLRRGCKPNTHHGGN